MLAMMSASEGGRWQKVPPVSSAPHRLLMAAASCRWDFEDTGLRKAKKNQNGGISSPHRKQAETIKPAQAQLFLISRG
jgi:hypothetical protein